MNIEDLLHSVNGTWVGKGKRKITGFSIDTRTLEKGNVYIALKGKNYDGHDFLAQADKKGASVAIVNRIPSKKSSKMRYLLVSDPLETMQNLARKIRNHFSIPVVAITGSVGKTTLKELLFHLLKNDYSVLKSEGNQNNDIGVPLTLLKMNETFSAVILELGMNHKEEIHRLSNICHPTIGVITRIGSAHIGNLGSKKNILAAKLEITDGMEQGVLLVNGKDPLLKKIKPKEIPCLKIGIGQSCSYHDVKVSYEKTEFVMEKEGKKYYVSFPYSGYHYPELICLAFEVGLLLGIDINTLIERLESFKGIKNRFEVLSLENQSLLIDDSYNANYESFHNALKLLKTRTEPKLLIVGEILELGKSSNHIHRKICKEFNQIPNAEIWFTGDAFYSLRNRIKNGRYFLNCEEMIKEFPKRDFKNMVIYVKASHRLQFDKIRKYFEK